MTPYVPERWKLPSLNVAVFVYLVIKYPAEWRTSLIFLLLAVAFVVLDRPRPERPGEDTPRG